MSAECGMPWGSRGQSPCERNAERRTSNAERGTSNVERGMRNVERGTFEL